MPFDGSGNFNRVMNWVSDAAAAIKIVATRHDAEDDNFASGLSNTLTKDGQSQPTANIPMNGKKLVNVGAPTNPTDAATKGYTDTADALKAPIADPIFTGKVTLPTGVAAKAPVSFPVITNVPTTPVDGDMWVTAAAGLKHRIAGVTYTYARLDPDQIFSARLGVGGAAIPANSRSALTLNGDIAFNAGYILGWNTYFDTVAGTNTAQAAGWGGGINLAPATGIINIMRSTASVAAGAAQTLAAAMSFDPVNGVAINGPAGLFKLNAGNVLVDNVDRLALAAGFGQAIYVDDGIKSSGTYTPTPAGGNMRMVKCAGAFNLAADATASLSYTMVMNLQNQAGAGTITPTGWSKVSGDPLDTVATSIFMLYITKISAFKTLNVEKIA